MDQSFRDMQRMQQQMDEELSRSMSELQQQQPGIRMERSEQRGYNSYRYYERIEISAGPVAAYAPMHAAPPPAALFSPLLIGALALGAVWAAVTALFAKNYDLTLFSERMRGRLLLQWPYLAAFSEKFRGQFVSALRGQRVKAAEEVGGGGGSGGSASS